MNCRRERFEFMEHEARALTFKICDDMFDALYAKIREYSQQRKLDEAGKKARGDPMDVGQLRAHDYDHEQDMWMEPSWKDEIIDHSYIAALGKGKGAMKGK